MDSNLLIKKALKSEFLSANEGQFLFENESTTNLMRIANYLRQEKVPGHNVTWQIDRNVNTTNIYVMLTVSFVIFFDHQIIKKATLLILKHTN